MRTASIIGMILIALGILSLAYFASPFRLLFQGTFEQHRINPVAPILGGLSLVFGIALLFAVRSRANKKKSEL